MKGKRMKRERDEESSLRTEGSLTYNRVLP